MSKPLLKSEWEVMQEQFKSEKAVLKALEEHYKEALNALNDRIAAMMGRGDANLPHVIRRIEYQKMVRAQVQAALDTLHGKEYETVSAYLQNTYTDAFVGTMYTLYHQDVPVIVPIDQNAVIKAVTIDSKVKSDLYTALGVDMTHLKKTIANEITRGIATGLLYDDITRNISNAAMIPMRRARTITRTEAGRVQEQASFDAAEKAKEAGADVVKQWSAVRDGKTRDSHRALDGQVRELNEPFSIGTHKAMHPHGFGLAEEDINCRCTMLTRARSALDEDDLKLMQERAEAAGLLVNDKNKKAFAEAKAKNFAEFKEKYLKAAESVENTGISGIIEKGKIAIPVKKLTGYALDPKKAPDKAKAFKLALGYDQSNADELLQNIVDHVDESKFVEKGNVGYGMLYQSVMRLTGPNGKQANVLTAWIDENGKKRLTSVYVTDKKVTE